MSELWVALRQRGQKGSDADLLREMIGRAAERLTGFEVRGQTGAAPGERAPDRSNQAPVFAAG